MRIVIQIYEDALNKDALCAMPLNEVIQMALLGAAQQAAIGALPLYNGAGYTLHDENGNSYGSLKLERD